MEYSNGGFRILIIDSSEDSREAMSFVFEKKGFIVGAATNIKEGMAMALQSKPNIIIINITISEIDALVAGKRLRENTLTHDIPIIFLSACKYVNEAICQLPGAKVEFIQKPCNARFLVKQANRLIEFSKLNPTSHERD